MNVKIGIDLNVQYISIAVVAREREPILEAVQLMEKRGLKYHVIYTDKWIAVIALIEVNYPTLSQYLENVRIPDPLYWYYWKPIFEKRWRIRYLRRMSTACGHACWIIARLARKYQITLKLEDLQGLHKRLRAKHIKWRYRAQWNYIAKGLASNPRIAIVAVNPAGTSSKCPICKAKVQPRPNRQLYCPNCRKTWNRDILAAVNIALKPPVKVIKPPGRRGKGSEEARLLEHKDDWQSHPPMWVSEDTQPSSRPLLTPSSASPGGQEKERFRGI